jgi:hypothetical protein
MNILNKITALRMERQHLINKADECKYPELYRDLQPGQNVYWHGFGDPPSLTHRAGFDDIEYNRNRQKERGLIKGRFAGGNVGWIMPEDLELFAGLYKKRLDKITPRHAEILELIEREGPLTIQQVKETTGLLVKEITPVLHRLQEAFLIYEDQYDGEWDRGWYKFADMFPDINLEKYTRLDALKIILKRFAFRHVLFDSKMAKSFYRLPEKEIKSAAELLLESGELCGLEGGFILKQDLQELEKYEAPPGFIYVMHRNDFLVRSNEHIIKDKFKQADCDILQYLLIDGELRGAVTGHFKYGPYILEDIVLDLPPEQSAGRQQEILEAVYAANGRGNPVKRYCGKEINKEC